jgi:hypothetical protein
VSDRADRFAEMAVDGARRLGVDPVEWMRLRSAEVALARYLLVVQSGDTAIDTHSALTASPRRLAAAVRAYDTDRLAAQIYASHDADSMAQAAETVGFLLDVWDRGSRV